MLQARKLCDATSKDPVEEVFFSRRRALQYKYHLIYGEVGSNTELLNAKLVVFVLYCILVDY